MTKPDIILAINDGHDANCTLADGENILLSSSRERFTRCKFQGGYPGEIINYIKNEYGIKKEDISQVIFTNRLNFVHRFFSKTFHAYYHDYFSTAQALYLFYQHFFRKIPLYQEFMDILSRQAYRGRFKGMIFLDHHLCHAASAYYYSGIQKALVITADNIGDGLSASVYRGIGDKLEIIKPVGCLQSPGQFYGEITQLLGFDPLKHAGKTTGLAAGGDPLRLYPLMEMLFYLSRDHERMHIRSVLNPWKKKWIKKKLDGYSREDIAAAAQKRLEDCFVDFIRAYINKTGIRDIVVSGGVFGNVKLNQHIFELPEVNQLYVHPGMSDCGLSMGALACYWMFYKKKNPEFLRSVYLGPEPGPIPGDMIDRSRYRVSECGDLTGGIAERLSRGRIVAICRGRMEYGPRALGNRSILYNPADKSVNDWLNQKLKRSEFMPFAPVVLDEDMNDLFWAKNGGCLSDRFMTITYTAKPVMKQKAPAVVHTDNTARPQVLRRADNEFFYDIIKKYREITGIPCLLNTSFNMHEEPIVMTAGDAYRAWVQADLDVLVINNLIIEKK